MKILIAGDFVPRNRVSKQIDTKDYSCLDPIKDFIKKVDYAIVNFESPVVTHKANPIVKVGPNLCCSENAMECVAKAGFNCVTLANNHFRDYGQIGVIDTLDSCRKHNMDYVGGGVNLEDAKKVLYKEINGERIAIVNICEAEWSIATNEYGGSFPINLPMNYKQITEARNKADYIIVIVHGGIEFYQYPTPRMVDMYRFFVDVGADTVVNHHQHCFSGYEVYKGKPIFYGLGNFCFDVNNPDDQLRTKGYMVELHFNKEEVQYILIPYIQSGEEPRVIPINNDDSKTFSEQIAIINKKISNPELLQREFEQEIQKLSKARLIEFEPFSNNWVRKLQYKGWLPSFMSEKTLKDIYCVINCESHREIILNLFGEKVSKL